MDDTIEDQPIEGELIQTPKNEHSTPSIATATLKQQIMRMRIDGVSFPDIAKALGMTQGYVYKQYKKALREIFREDVEELRQVENQRLNELWAEADELRKRFTPLVNSGVVVNDILRDDVGEPILDESGATIPCVLEDIGPRFKAIEIRLKIMERYARLNGLDVPNKLALTDPTGQKESSNVLVYLPDNGRT